MRDGAVTAKLMMRGFNIHVPGRICCLQVPGQNCCRIWSPMRATCCILTAANMLSNNLLAGGLPHAV